MKFTLFIDRERCKGCILCINACAKAVLKMSKKLNSKGFHYPETVKPENCIGCKNCAIMCPDAAIEIESDAGSTESNKHTPSSKTADRKKR